MNLKLEIRPTDFKMGDGNIVLQGTPPVPSGDWTPFVEFFERQMLNSGDSDSCVLFTTQENLDAQIEQQIQSGAISPQTVAWFDSLGYMDVGTDNLKHFHTSPRWLAILTGNGLNGNSVQDGWDVLRKFGALPYKDLPVDPTLTPEQFVSSAAITQDMKNKGQQFLLGVGGKNFAQYHWVIQGSGNFQAATAALPFAPLCDGVVVNDGWNQSYPTPPASGLNPGHCVMRIRNVIPLTAVEYDHYLPNPKFLANYPIWYSLQAIIKITPPPPPPTLPPNPTPTQESNWLSQIVTWLSGIFGPKVGSTTNNMNITSYSFWKSRTFWVIVFTFAYNGYAAISGQLPADVTVVVNAAVGLLATYFHIDGVNKAAVSSSTLGVPSSGQ